jgi:hypothetical protein
MRNKGRLKCFKVIVVELGLLLSNYTVVPPFLCFKINPLLVGRIIEWQKKSEV